MLQENTFIPAKSTQQSIDEACFLLAKKKALHASLFLDTEFAHEVMQQGRVLSAKRVSNRVIDCLAPLEVFTGKNENWGTKRSFSGTRELLEEIRMRHSELLQKTSIDITGERNKNWEYQAQYDLFPLDTGLGIASSIFEKNFRGQLGRIGEEIIAQLVGGTIIDTTGIRADIAVERNGYKINIECKTGRIPHASEWEKNDSQKNACTYPSHKQFVTRTAQLNHFLQEDVRMNETSYYAFIMYNLIGGKGMTIKEFFGRKGFEENAMVPNITDYLVFPEIWIFPTREVGYMVAENIDGAYPLATLKENMLYPTTKVPLYLKTQEQHLASMALRMHHEKIPEYKHVTQIFGRECMIRSFWLKFADAYELEYIV